MGGNAAKKGNYIAMLGLLEQQRQYAEQQRKEREKKEAAKNNALGSRTSSNRAYANNFNPATDYTSNLPAGSEGNYSLLTSGGTDMTGSIYNDKYSSTLG